MPHTFITLNTYYIRSSSNKSLNQNKRFKIMTKLSKKKIQNLKKKLFKNQWSTIHNQYIRHIYKNMCKEKVAISY